MARNSSKSKLRSRLAKTKVRATTRDKAPEAPTGQLPPGINNGIAKLTRVDFDEIKSGDYKGEQRFYAHGNCVKPKKFTDSDGNIHNLENVLVQLGTIVLADTKSYSGDEISFEENFAKAENRMKLLGIPTEDIDDDTFEEDVINFCKEEELYFRFETWSPEDSDRTIVKLLGVCDAPEGDDDDDDEVEEEEPDTLPFDSDDEDEDEDEKASDGKDEEPEVDPKKLKALARKADKGDEDAQTELAEIADSLDVDIEAIDTWKEAAEAIINAGNDDEDEDEDEDEDDDDEEEVVPEKGDVYEYDEDEYTVTAVFVKKKTVNLKGVEDGKKVTGVPWTKLKSIDE